MSTVICSNSLHIFQVKINDEALCSLPSFLCNYNLRGSKILNLLLKFNFGWCNATYSVYCIYSKCIEHAYTLSKLF